MRDCEPHATHTCLCFRACTHINTHTHTYISSMDFSFLLVFHQTASYFTTRSQLPSSSFSPPSSSLNSLPSSIFLISFNFIHTLFLPCAILIFLISFRSTYPYLSLSSLCFLTIFKPCSFLNFLSSFIHFSPSLSSPRHSFYRLLPAPLSLPSLSIELSYMFPPPYNLHTLFLSFSKYLPSLISFS